MSCIAECKLLDSRNEKKVKCGGMCGNYYHIKCVGVKEMDLNYINESKQIFYLCMLCINFKKSLLEKIENINNCMEENKNIFIEQSINLQKITKKIEIEFNVMNKKNDENKTKFVEELKKVGNTSHTYAGICKTNIPPVLVKPKKNQKVTQTMKDLENIIDPTSISIKNIKSKQNGTIEIESENSDEREKLKTVVEEKLGENYKIDIVDLRNPKIFLHKMRVNRENDDIIERIKSQNEYLKENEIKVIKVIEKKFNRNDVYYNVILETDRDGYHKAIEKGKIFIGWDACHVFDATYVKRCYKCLGFNHKAENCKSDQVCAKCSKNHKTESCKREDFIKKCNNCIKANKVFRIGVSEDHSILSKDCPVYNEKLRIEKQRILY